MNYRIDGDRRHMIPTGQVNLAFPICAILPNSEYVSCSKTRPTVAFSFSLTILLHHIVRIICLCAKEKMIGAATRTIIAMMKYIESFGQITKNVEIGKSVSKTLFPQDCFPITVVKLSPSPNPAWAEFGAVLRDWAIPVDLRPEAGNILCGKLKLHLTSPFQMSGATPRGVSAPPRLSCVPSIARHSASPQWEPN